MKKRGWTLLLTGVVAGGAGLALPALPAVGSHSPPGFFHDVEVGEPVRLLAKGAAIVVPVEVRCGPGAAFASVSVQASQSRGRHVATAGGSTGGGPIGGAPVTCDGTVQVIEVLLTPQGGAFKSGEAVVRATLFVCPATPGPCQEDTDVEIVTIRK